MYLHNITSDFGIVCALSHLKNALIIVFDSASPCVPLLTNGKGEDCSQTRHGSKLPACEPASYNVFNYVDVHIEIVLTYRLDPRAMETIVTTGTSACALR